MKPLPVYLKTVSKKNNTSILGITSRQGLLSQLAAFLFFSVILISCTPREDRDGLAVVAGYVPGPEGSLGPSLLIEASWPRLPALVDEVFDDAQFTRTVEIGLDIRNKDLLVGRMNLHRELIIGFDPYNRVYYLQDGDNSTISYTFVEMLSELESAVKFEIRREELAALGGEVYEIRVKAKLSRLGVESVFRRWMSLFNLVEYSAEAVIEFDSNI